MGTLILFRGSAGARLASTKYFEYEKLNTYSVRV